MKSASIYWFTAQIAPKPELGREEARGLGLPPEWQGSEHLGHLLLLDRELNWK